MTQRKAGRWTKPRAGGYQAKSTGRPKPPPPNCPGAASRPDNESTDGERREHEERERGRGA